MASKSIPLAITSEEALILSMMYGMLKTRSLSLIVGLNIPEILCKESPLSIDDIALRSGCNSSIRLYPIMRVLAQMGIGIELENKQFTTNRSMQLLRRDQGPSLGHVVSYVASDELCMALQHLPHFIKYGGKPPFEHKHGMSTLDYMNEIDSRPYDKEKTLEGATGLHIGSEERRRSFAEIYSDAMQVYSYLNVLPGVKGINNIYEAFPWDTCKEILDIGGCSGELVASIMKQPNCGRLKGYIADLPVVIDAAVKDMANLGVPKDRITFIKHDFSQPFPSDLNVDTIIMKNLLSMCMDKVPQIFQNSRPVIQKGGRVLVIEMCFPDEAEYGINGLREGLGSVHLQNIVGRRLNSKEEWIEMLKDEGSKAGYQFQRVRTTFSGGASIFELSAV